MADNSQYAFGMDWYEDNTVSSWPALVAWDKRVRFAYFRLGIGLHADNLKLLNECHNQTPWDLGGYYEVYLSTVPKDWQLKVLREQLARAPFLKLPVALAFEKQTRRDAKGNKIVEWPSVGDLKYLATEIANMGYRVNIYAGLSGLEIIKASRLIDMSTADWWIARGYFFPLWSTEMDIAGTLALLQRSYGIQPEHVQFFQTVLDHGNSPIGSGQDFDRAVSWSFEPTPPPPPATIPAIDIMVQSDRADLLSVTADGADARANTTFHVKPFEPEPPQPPPSELGIHRILNDWEAPAKYYGGKSRTASQEWTDKGGNPMTPETIKLHGADPVTTFPLAAVKLVHTLNDPTNTFGYVTREAAGWSNRGQEWPDKMEPIAFCNNKVDVIRVDGNRKYIRTWHGEIDDPCVIHNWTNIDKENNLYGAQNPGATGPGKIVLAYSGDYWIDADRLEKV